MTELSPESTGDKGVRVRFAPAPSGDLHVGNIRSALYSWAYGRRHGGTFVLRMEERVDLRRRERALLALVGGVVFLSMAIALYAFIEPVGSGRVYIQGRYLAPVILVLLLSVYGIRFAPRRVGLVFVGGTMLVVMLETIRTLASTYHA